MNENTITTKETITTRPTTRVRPARRAEPSRFPATKDPINRIRSLVQKPSPRPKLQVLPQLERASRTYRAPSSAGLIAITGPPMSGKQALGHSVNASLSDSIHLNQTDSVVADLRDEDPESMGDLLRTIRSELRCGHKVVFSARLASPEQRRRVLNVARELGVPRLLVELEGTDPAAIERASEVADTLQELRDVLGEFKELLPQYRSLTEREQHRILTVTVPAEQPVEEQVKTVLDGWDELGAVH